MMDRNSRDRYFKLISSIQFELEPFCKLKSDILKRSNPTFLADFDTEKITTIYNEETTELLRKIDCYMEGIIKKYKEIQNERRPGSQTEQG